LADTNIWRKVFAWWLVKAEDELAPILWQHIWRKRGENGRWRYRSFRSQEEQEQEFWDNQT
jgi:hypothetical protein